MEKIKELMHNKAVLMSASALVLVILDSFGVKIPKEIYDAIVNLIASSL
jgi:hypothetical protein